MFRIQVIACGVYNFISLYTLFIRFDFNIPYVIQSHFLCLYLFNLTVLTGKFRSLAFSIMPSNYPLQY